MDKAMNEDQVIRIVATKGPIIPIQVVKEIGGNTMFAGAILSQLVDKKRVIVSSIKMGGSPLYYIKGQESRLQDYVKYLNEKDRQAFELLRNSKILRDTEQSALSRVCLRNIKDFAVPLEVKFGDQTEIFWKWYLLSDENATELIKNNLNIPQKEREEKKLEEKKPEEKRESDTHLQEFGQERKERLRPAEIKAPEKTPEPARDMPININADTFLEKIANFLKTKDISIKKAEVKKKASEIELILLVPSAVGQIEYYCRAKNKKSISDADISAAYVQGQLKKLPAMLLTTGDVTKKAKELLSKDIKISIMKM